jgi:omega-hydroxy-beta-dihydromenaquinone-9 sulfotransferase
MQDAATSTLVRTRPSAAASPPRREWAPRIWEGCDFFAWLHLLARNRFAVHWSHVYIAIIITLVSVWHTVLRHLQELLYGEEIARTPIDRAPIFIIGHWRAGTTLLHELLVLDPRHTYPTTYECLEPNHFLLTETFFQRWMRFLLPSHRPMDNMPAGWERPQEDEFALCMLGQPSPYLAIAFPNSLRGTSHALELDLKPRELKQWKRTFLRFIRQLSFKSPRRIVLKSPPHSCRIRVLLELFPRARFIHLVRNPYVVFPSTVNLWKSLYRTHGLQHPTFVGLDEQVFGTFVHLYSRLEEERGLIPASQFYELRYEDLIRDPVGQMRDLYNHLGIDGFEIVLPRLREYLAMAEGYATNRYGLSCEQKAEITRRWGHVIRRYGYALEESSAAPPAKPALPSTV